MLNFSRVLVLLHLTMILGQLVTVDDNEGAMEDPIVTPSNLQIHRCDQELGMESGDIRDDSVAVSSAASAYEHGKEDARLNGESAWVALARKKQWIEIDLGKLMQVTGVKTQSKVIPRYGEQLWVTEYKVLYKMYRNQSNWNVISGAGGGPKVLPGNSNGISTKTNVFENPIQAELIRIVPVSWTQDTDKIAMRLELLGCGIEGRSGCGSPRVMRNPHGSIFSMNYPDNYKNNANCRWDITAPTAQVVILEFTKVFGLEASHNTLCLDYVEVLDVIGNAKRSLGKFCGNVSPGKLASTYHRMKINFLTDHFEAYCGFKAEYRFVNGSNCGGPMMLEDSSGDFQTMNYPGNYENYANCVWDIYTDSDQLIEIHFTEMRIRGIPNACSSDSLQIIDMGKAPGDVRSLAVTRLCGISTPSNYLSSSSRLRIMFESDEELSDRGFKATYTSVHASGCGGKRDLRRPRGIIASLNYPKPYDNGLRCEWNIEAGVEEDIQITFLNFDLEEHNDCQYDHVSIYDGRRERHLLGKYCNKLNLQPLVAHSGAMKVIFESDTYNARSGFEASYTVMARSGIAQLKTTAKSTTGFVSVHVTVPAALTTSKFEEITSPAQSTFPRKPSTRTMKSAAYSTVASKHKNNKPPPDSRMDGKNPFVTEEFAKWIIIGMVSVAGLVVTAIVIGVVLCCRQHRANTNTSAQGSLRNASSGMMQNPAYDFSLGSTSQSIRSRQIDAAESSQVSETISHLDPLRPDLNRDSHIYFSIDDYCRKNKQNSSAAEQSDVKIHFKNIQQGSHVAMDESDQSATSYQSEDEGGYDDDVIVTCESGSEDYSEPSTGPSVARCTGNEMEPSVASTSKSNPEKKPVPPKLMVENILYESRNNVDDEGS